MAYFNGSKDFIVVVGRSGGTIELDNTLTEYGKAADAGTVGDALKEKANKSELEKYVTGIEFMQSIKAVLTEGEMDTIIENETGVNVGAFYMYLGETTTKYKQGAVYTIKEA